jgi:N-acetyl-anhydromuramyl-L-alanine amidase AmpD
MKPTHIVIHHSLTKDNATVSWDAIRWYHTHTNGWTQIGYHLGIELIGNHYEVLMGRMMNEVGAHCKDGGMNSKSIGICLVGNFDHDPPCIAQMDILIKLTRSLMELFSIPAENVNRHSDFAGYKSCPGTAFPWSAFKAAIQ